MSKLFVCLTAASTLALSGAAFAQTTSTTTSKAPGTPPAATKATPPATPGTTTPPVNPEGMSATPANPAAPAGPATPPAAQDAPMAQASAQPGTAAAPATTPAPATPTASVATGMTLKDNTGASVGQITDLKADASGAQMATVKMGEDSFTVAANSLAVQNGAAVINLTQAQLQAMVHKPKS